MTTTAKAKHGPEFGRQRLPERFCNLDRLLADMEARELDGLVVTTPAQRLLAHELQRHRPQGRRAQALRRDPGPARTRAPRHGARRLLPDDAALPADLGQGHSAVPVGDGGHGPPAAGGRRRRPHTVVGGRGRVDGAGAGRLPVRFRRAGARGDARPRHRPRTRRLRRRGLRQAARPGQRRDRRRLRPADARAGPVKTPAELELLARATRLNEKAIRRTVSRWEEGWTRQDLNHAYAVSAVELGGFVGAIRADWWSATRPARTPP